MCDVCFIPFHGTNRFHAFDKSLYQFPYPVFAFFAGISAQIKNNTYDKPQQNSPQNRRGYYGLYLSDNQRVLPYKFDNPAKSNNTTTAVKRKRTTTSTIRSVITVPKSLGSDIFSYRLSTTQRATSPIRGRSRFIK